MFLLDFQHLFMSGSFAEVFRPHRLVCLVSALVYERCNTLVALPEGLVIQVSIEAPNPPGFSESQPP